MIVQKQLHPSAFFPAPPSKFRAADGCVMGGRGVSEASNSLLEDAAWRVLVGWWACAPLRGGSRSGGANCARGSCRPLVVFKPAQLVSGRIMFLSVFLKCKASYRGSPVDKQACFALLARSRANQVHRWHVRPSIKSAPSPTKSNLTFKCIDLISNLSHRSTLSLASCDESARIIKGLRARASKDGQHLLPRER